MDRAQVVRPSTAPMVVLVATSQKQLLLRREKCLLPMLAVVDPADSSIRQLEPLLPSVVVELVVGIQVFFEVQLCLASRQVEVEVVAHEQVPLVEPVVLVVVRLVSLVVHRVSLVRVVPEHQQPLVVVVLVAQTLDQPERLSVVVRVEMDAQQQAPMVAEQLEDLQQVDSVDS